MPDRSTSNCPSHLDINQLKSAPTALQVVANVARSKAPGRSFTLEALLEDSKAIVKTPQSDIRSFTLTLSQPTGSKRGQGKGSFVSSVTSLVDRFYVEVVQPLKAWTPPAPKPKESQSVETNGSDSESGPVGTAETPSDYEPVRTLAPMSVTAPIEPNSKRTVTEGLPAPHGE